MSLVLDASVALAWIYPDETTDAVRRTFEEIISDGAIVPAHWRLEVGNSLSAAVRRQRITGELRAAAVRDLRVLDITIDNATNENAWDTTMVLAERHHLTLYDAAYLELAQRRALPLASLDADLRAAAQALGLRPLGL